jgi:hypothetical protein
MLRMSMFNPRAVAMQKWRLQLAVVGRVTPCAPLFETAALAAGKDGDFHHEGHEDHEVRKEKKKKSLFIPPLPLCRSPFATFAHLA